MKKSLDTREIQYFAEVCLNAKKAEEIAVPLTRFLDGLLIESWYVGTLAHESDLDRVGGFGHFGMPLGFQKAYADQRFSDDDPVFQYAIAEERPTTWSEIRRQHEDTEAASSLRVFDFARDFKLREGYIRPVHTTGERPAAATFGGARIDTSPQGLAALDLLAAYAFEGFRRYSVGFKAIAPYLTPREREVLCWSAEGKSAWDISQIMSIAEATVRAHQKNLRIKYGSSTITRVAVIAALNRTITTLPSLLPAA